MQTLFCRLLSPDLSADLSPDSNCHIKSCTFYRPDKVFSRQHSNTKRIHLSASKLELYTGKSDSRQYIRKLTIKNMSLKGLIKN